MALDDNRQIEKRPASSRIEVAAQVLIVVGGVAALTFAENRGLSITGILIAVAAFLMVRQILRSRRGPGDS